MPILLLCDRRRANTGGRQHHATSGTPFSVACVGINDPDAIDEVPAVSGNWLAAL
jgi:hypothetical protein